MALLRRTLAVLLCTIGVCTAMKFDVSGFPKCFTEELQKGTLSVGTYHVIQPTPQDADKVNVRVTGAHGESLHSEESHNSGHFAFTSEEDGQYVACFWVPPELGRDRKARVDLDWKVGLHATDYESVAKKDKLNELGLELRKLEDMTHDLQREMAHYRKIEESMRDLVELTNTRVAYFSVFGLLLCTGLAGLQLWYLKTFFERKKIL